MPELPEVETIRSQLKKEIIGRKIKSVVVKRATVLQGISAASFKKALTGRKIKDVLRKGKLLIFALDQKYLLAHLRMSGWFLYGKKEEPKARIVFKLNDGAVLNYMDQRTLGRMSIRNDYTEDSFYKSLGPEITEVSEETFNRLLEKRGKAKIKGFLLDQRCVSGIGNIYACEGLFRAKIHPERIGASLSSKEKKLLLSCLRKVLQEAIQREGSSVNTFRNIYGQKGSMCSSHRVYGRKGQACFVCKFPVSRSVVSGRGTFLCERCQR